MVDSTGWYGRWLVVAGGAAEFTLDCAADSASNAKATAFVVAIRASALGL